VRRLLVVCLLVACACGGKKKKPPGESESDQLAKKEIAYVICLNATDADTCMPEYIGECRNGIAAASQLPPSLPALEKAGAQYIAIVQKLAPLCAERKEVPAELATARAALTKEVDAIEDRIQAADLAEVEKREGKKLHWHHLKLLMAAKAAARTPGADTAAALEAAIEAVGKVEGKPRGYRAVEFQARELVKAVRGGERDVIVRVYNALIDTSNRTAL
jgi:hypothetical protein